MQPTPEQVKAQMTFEKQLDETEVAIKLTMKQWLVLFKVLTNTSFVYGDFDGIAIRPFKPENYRSPFRREFKRIRKKIEDGLFENGRVDFCADRLVASVVNERDAF